jgi:hypothetical protein
MNTESYPDMKRLKCITLIANIVSPNGLIHEKNTKITGKKLKDDTLNNQFPQFN